MRRILLLCPLLVAGCQARDVDTLAQIGQVARQKFQASFGTTPEAVASRVRGPIGDTGLAGRVRVRLLHDRHLQGADVEITVPSSGVVRLRATLSNDEARQRVLELTRSTAGVEQVIDEMKLAGE